MQACRRRHLILVLAISLAVPLGAALGGCESYLEESTARTAGEFADDATIQFIVKRRLIAAREVRGRRVDVEVNKGVVTLIGTVRTEDERQRAVAIAAGVPNVTKVVDKLTRLRSSGAVHASGVPEP